MFAADGKKFWFVHGVVKHGLCIHFSLSLSPLPPSLPPKKNQGRGQSRVLRVMELLLPILCCLKLHVSLKSCMPVQGWIFSVFAFQFYWWCLLSCPIFFVSMHSIISILLILSVNSQYPSMDYNFFCMNSLASVLSVQKLVIL